MSLAVPRLRVGLEVGAHFLEDLGGLDQVFGDAGCGRGEVVARHSDEQHGSELQQHEEEERVLLGLRVDFHQVDEEKVGVLEVVVDRRAPDPDALVCGSGVHLELPEPMLPASACPGRGSCSRVSSCLSFSGR